MATVPTVSQMKYVQASEVPNGSVLIYGLVDPRTLHIRYIGVTNNCRRRYASHVNQPGVSIEAWIEDLDSDGIDPIMIKIWVTDEPDTTRDALAQNMEQWWVGLLDDYGCDLLNRKIIRYLWNMSKHDHEG